jgi:hypothetical protein
MWEWKRCFDCAYLKAESGTYSNIRCQRFFPLSTYDLNALRLGHLLLGPKGAILSSKPHSVLSFFLLDHDAFLAASLVPEFANMLTGAS